MKRAYLAVLVVLMLALSTGAQAAEKLVIISPHQASIREEYTAAFQAWYKVQKGVDVNVEWRDVGGTSDILRFVNSEFQKKPTGIGIDVFWGGGVDPYIELSDKGLLMPYKLPAEQLAKIPADIGGVPMYDPKYRWYGSALSGFGIMYNKVVLKKLGLPEPQSWVDLADPRYSNWVGSIDLRHSGAGHAVYEAILQGLGWEEGFKVVTGMAANTRQFARGSSDGPKAIAAGDLAVGGSIDFYAWAQVAEHGADKIGFVLPDNMTYVNPDSMAILKGAPNAEVAKAFLRFVLSSEGQKLWMLPPGAPGGPTKEPLGRLAVMPSVYTELGNKSLVPFNPFKLKGLIQYDAEKASNRWNVLNDLVGATLIDPHANLTSTWKAIIDGGMKKQAVNAISKCYITEAEAAKLASTWSDQVLRNRTIAQWSTQALAAQAEARKLAK